jgi:hypothetical protein
MPGNPDLFGPAEPSEGDEVGTPSGFFDAVAAAGEKRGAGRPPGARNRKTEAFEKWFYARGYRDPAQVLAEIITMDPRALQQIALEDRVARGELQQLGTKDDPIQTVSVPGLVEIIDLQRKAAIDLMPYLHGKKPTEVVITDERLPILVVASGTNQMAEAAKLIEGRVVMSIGQPLQGEAEASEINDLAEGDK